MIGKNNRHGTICRDSCNPTPIWMVGDMGKWTGSVESTGLWENGDRTEHESGGGQRVYKTIEFPLLFVSIHQRMKTAIPQ